MQDTPLVTQIVTLSALAIAFTVGVYGLVAGIVKLDDLGLHLANAGSKAKVAMGKFLLSFAPFLMKSLSVIGTIAMFLVGGGILMHDVPFLHHLEEVILSSASGMVGAESVLLALIPTLNAFVLGFVAGALCLLLWTGVSHLLPKKEA